MKFRLPLLLMVLNAAAFGQLAVVGQESGVSVLKHSWTKERLDWDDAEVITPSGVSTATRPRLRPPKAVREKQAREQRSIRLNSSKPKQEPEDSRFMYTYELVVQNVSSKMIREIDWDYVFIDKETREELGRRQFTSVEKIGAGKKKKLSMRVSSPPTQTIKISQSGKTRPPG